MRDVFDIPKWGPILFAIALLIGGVALALSIVNVIETFHHNNEVIANLNDRLSAVGSSG